MTQPILERDRERAELLAAAREAAAGVGSVVLITGEAGIGKSSLVDSLPAALPPDGRLLVGYCDDLATRRVLGPLRDLIGSVGAPLARALESGNRAAVLDELPAELASAGPAVLVVEDVHWADEATLDVLRFLVRRLAGMPAVLVLTYRDDELTRDHPLRHLLGLISRTARVRRLPLAPLSADAVRRLGADSGLNPDQVYALTSGNPFFVVEVFAGGDPDGVPATVSEAVHARLADLDATVRDALEMLAVVPSAAEGWLVEAVVPGGAPTLAPAEQYGVLVLGRQRVAFRHELMRRSILDAMPISRRMACNRAVLDALLDPAHPVDVSRVVHHAAEAGDDGKVVRFGLVAASEAVAAGSHTEAVAHYRRLVERRSAFSAPQQAELLESYAVECYTTGYADLAVTAQQEAVHLRRNLRDAAQLGLALRWLSRMQWWAGELPAAEASGAEAAVVLADAGDRRALALTLSNESQLHMLAGRWAQSITAGRRAAEMARELNDPAILSHALTNIGASVWDADDAEGERLLREALAVARAAGEGEHACRAYACLIWCLTDRLRLGEADRVAADAIRLADDGQFLGFLNYFGVERSVIALARGDWDQAERQAEWSIDAQPTTHCPALVVRGRVRVRRGVPGGQELLAEAWELSRKLGEAQRVGPAAAALVESAWLAGDTATAVAAVLPWYEHVRTHTIAGLRSELAYWLRLAGAPVEMDPSDHPYALLASGRWREAADRWLQAGCPYEYALALTDSDESADLLTALATLDDLGAEPLARRVRRRLRNLGVARVPRGPSPSTKDNPAGLTGRQAEVVRLLADGLTNAEIATRLVLSVRTVDTHVAAILDKLDVATRQDAVRRAGELGLLGA